MWEMNLHKVNEYSSSKTVKLIDEIRNVLGVKSPMHEKKCPEKCSTKTFDSLHLPLLLAKLRAYGFSDKHVATGLLRLTIILLRKIKQCLS